MSDANGTRFHLITGPRDWNPALSAGGNALRFDSELNGITLAQQLFRFPQRDGADAPTPDARRGAALDRYGNLFVIGPDERSIEIHPAGLGESGQYWPSGDDGRHSEAADAFKPLAPQPVEEPRLLRGLAVTTLSYGIVGMLDPAGLLILDLHGGGPAECLHWPEEIAFAPFDMFAADDGGLWVLDRGPAPGEARWWRLDRHYRPTGGMLAELAPAEIDDFKPVGGEPAIRPSKLFPTGFALSAAAGFDPRAIVGLRDETVLILGNEAGSPVSSILRFDGETLLDAVALEGRALDGLLPTENGIVAYDMTLHPAADDAVSTVTGTLRLIASDGNQAFDLAFRALPSDQGGTLELRLLPRYYPVRGFAGGGLIEAGAETLYDLGRRYASLVAQPRVRYAERGVVDLRFDGGTPDLAWHRVVLDACIPEGAGVVIETRTAEEETDLDVEEWHIQPAPHRRSDGADLPFHDPFPDRTSNRGAGVWELLIQNRRGRWLELRLRAER